MLKSLSLFGIAALLCSYNAAAQQPVLVSLSENSHVCNTEAEIARLAENEQLQEMAKGTGRNQTHQILFYSAACPQCS